VLDPSINAAVVGGTLVNFCFHSYLIGNVLTSQRVTDVFLKAFDAAAASQGCMNNFTFGHETLGYYETIAGGAGAGPTWHGQSGVHTHMTNTRITGTFSRTYIDLYIHARITATDAEVLERRYPVLLTSFSLRKGSGGRGKYNGGDGVIREIKFLVVCVVIVNTMLIQPQPVTASILSERRTYRMHMPDAS